MNNYFDKIVSITITWLFLLFSWCRRDSFKNQSSIVKFQVTQEDPVCSVYEIPLNELDLVNRLGVGSYGEVNKAANAKKN